MGFSVVCHECGEVLYEGRDMIPLYRLRAKCDNKCPACGRKLSITPLSIVLEPIENLELEHTNTKKSIFTSK